LVGALASLEGIMSIPAPKGLEKTGRKLWSATTDNFDLRQDELETLRAACGEADLILRMELEIASSELTTEGSQGQVVVHPLVQEIRQHRSTMAALLRSLKLPDDSLNGAVSQQRAAAQSRWASAHGSVA
jgi:hypothetical protein